MDREFATGYYASAYRNYRAQNPAHKFAFYRSLLQAHRQPQQPRTIHDVGCAFGLFLNSLGDEWQCCGSDISPEAVAYAREQMPQAEFHLAGATERPSARSFSALTAWDVLEHVPDLELAAHTLDQQLDRQGLFLFVVPVYDGPLGPVVNWLDNDETHVHRCGRQFWLDWAARHFSVVEWQGVVRYLLPWGSYLHYPTVALRRVAPAIAVVCRKRDAVVG